MLHNYLINVNIKCQCMETYNRVALACYTSSLQNKMSVIFQYNAYIVTFRLTLIVP